MAIVLQVCNSLNVCATSSNTLTILPTLGGGDLGGGGAPGVGATPELDSLMLFGSGLAGLAGYAATRLRARRRKGE